jgi:preprotein translocase subunit SecE
MATRAVKMSSDESQGGTGSELTKKLSGTIANSREFLHDVRVEMKQVTWPSREDVVSTTGVVVATVFFFGVFLTVVDWLVQKGVTYILKVFGV